MKKAEREWLGKVAQHGCIVCNNMGIEDSPCEIHHLRAGAGIGQRSNHYHAIPLCPRHHRTGGLGIALHAGQTTWEEKFGTEEELHFQLLESMGVDDEARS